MTQLTGRQLIGPEYDEHARARWVDEPLKRSGRTDFERDRGRVLHSAALRRLAAKTQVVVPWESDFPRTRLTHSLECAQIGRELGKALGCDPDLVDTACLAHDLGHPPFGHTGESALAEVARDHGGFEGNAQSLRILTRLETKTFDLQGRSVGLNLTRAVLDAACKYPWQRSAKQAASGKFGVYDDDLPVFSWLRDGAPGEARRCLEAQVMDWADDVAYSVHDLEDALYAGHVQLAVLADQDERGALVQQCGRRCPDVPEDRLMAALDRLLSLPYWPVSYDGSPKALAVLKNAASQLIGRFCQAAEEATRAAAGEDALTRYAADLVVPEEVRLECEVLKAVAARYVMDSAAATDRYQHQRSLILELVEALLVEAQRGSSPDLLEPALRTSYMAASGDDERLRAVIDHVASLTDRSAAVLHRKLTA
jgi:dGTPase